MESKSKFEIIFTAAISVLLFFISLFLIGYFTHWAAALGVFILRWSMNIEQNLIEYKNKLIFERKK